MNNRTVIVSGGMLDEEFALSILREQSTEYIIAVDRGLAFLYRFKIRPDVILGDFDSLPAEILAYYQKNTDIPVRRFNPVKDATDTENAIRLAIEKGKKSIRILGATGSRLDHVWSNVQSLKIALDAGVEAEILDPNNRIRLFDRDIVLQREEAFGKCFSLFPLNGPVEDLSISGAKYPLYKHRLEPFDSLCVSNEIQGEAAEIRFPEGLVILMETRD
jgi:thiamine pyrophosphokinase